MAPIRVIPTILAPFLLGTVMLAHAQQAPKTDANPCPSGGQGSTSTDSSSQQKGNGSEKAQPSQAPCAPVVEPSAAEKFPFPGAAPQMPGSQPSETDAPAPSSNRPSSADEHPFPGHAPPMPGSEGSSSSNGGYSSSNDGSSAPPTDDADKAATPRPSGRRRLPKVQKLQTDEDRADEDLRIAKFYENKGDLNAAYLRVRDAVKSLPNDSETHYHLARIAEKLNKRDEAVAEYNAYLKLEPDGEYIKQARKAIDTMQPK